MKIERDVLLAQFTTVRVGGPAEHFVKVKTTEDVKKALEFAREKNLSVFVLGGGSNVLFADDGFHGLVIKNELYDLEFNGSKARVGSGVLLAALIQEAIQRKLAGLGQLVGVPGTVGGAVAGNANEIGEKVTAAKILAPDGSAKTLSPADLQFGYRSSALKGSDNFLLEIELKLAPGGEDLQKEFAEQAREKNLKQPFEGTAGSWFKNPPTPRLRRTSSDDKKAWQLIDEAGCRGLQVGDAVVSEKHSNFFQNLGEATAKDFLELEKIVLEKVEQKFGVRLEREVVVVGL